MLTFFVSYLSFAQGSTDFTWNPSNPCSGDVVTFTIINPIGGATYQWEFPDGSTSASSSPAYIFDVSPGNDVVSQSVSLIITQGANSETVTKSIEVKQPPSTVLIDPSNWPEFSKCDGGGNFVLVVQNGSTTSNTSYTITWGDGEQNVFGASFTSATHTYPNIGYYLLEFTVASSNGCESTQVYPVLNASNPELGIEAGSTIGCAPLTLDFYVTNTSQNLATTYTFSFNDGSQPYVFGPDVPPPTMLTHTFNDASCGGATDFFTLTAIASNQCDQSTITYSPIKVNREPVAIIAADTNKVCINQDIIFLNQSQQGCGGNPNLTHYVWFVEDVENGSGSSLACNFDTPGIKTIKLRAQNTSINCNQGISWDEMQVTVFGDEPLNSPGVITGDSQFGCQGDGFEFTFTIEEVENATDYEWIIPSGATVVSGAGTNSITLSFSPSSQVGVVEIQVRARNACSQSALSEVFSFEILPLPGPIGPISGENQLCQGEEYILTYTITSPAVPGEIEWFVPSGSEILSGQGTLQIEVQFSGEFQSGSIRVSATNDCGSAWADDFPVTLNPIPVPASQISGPTEVCQGETSVFIIPSVQYAQSLEWFVNGESVPSVSESELEIEFDTPGQFQISVRGVNSCGVGALSDIFVVIVNPSPQPVFNPQDHCFGQPVPLFNDGDQGDDQQTEIVWWSWEFGDGYSSSLPQPVHTYDQIATYTITLTVLTDKGCPGKDSATINVQPVPSAYFFGHGMPSLNEQGPTLSQHDRLFTPPFVRSSMLNPTISFVDRTIADNTTEFAADPQLIADNALWRWEVGELDAGSNMIYYEGQGLREQVHRYSKPGLFEVKQIVSSAFGCQDSSFLKVQIIEEVFVPNAFLGGGADSNGGNNGNGGLGVFKPIFGWDEGVGDIGYEFWIFNRWGELIFHTQKVEEGWDGTIKGGKEAPGGVYAWRFKYKSADGKVVNRTGTVLLLR